jgi:hypothetical protein
MKTLVTGIVCLVVGVAIGQAISHSKSDRMPAPAVAPNVSAISSTRRLAQEIEVPVARFENTPIKEALDYLRLRSRTNPNDSSVADRLAFVLVDPNKTARPMDLSHQHVKMDILCERVAELSGLNVAFEEDAIVFRAK